MSQLLAIIWDFKPEIFPNLDFPILGNIRWYGVLWAISFLAANYLVTLMYKKENRKLEELDTLFMYALVGCILGARLGHCLFYDPVYYLPRPLEILKVWEGGLASHGGGIGLFVASFLFQRRYKNQSFKAILDKIAFTVAIAGCLIRLGNFLNSEIIGKPTDLSFGVAFVENINSRLTHPENYGKSIDKIEYKALDGDTVIDNNVFKAYSMSVTFNPNYPTDLNKESIFSNMDRANEYLIYSGEAISIEGNTFSSKVYPVTRHPAQLYESISCLLLFLVMYFLYFKQYDGKLPEGLFIGLFLTYVFILRFLYEFLKENQEVHEEGWFINTGQILSIPAIILGVYFLYTALKSKSENI